MASDFLPFGDVSLFSFHWLVCRGLLLDCLPFGVGQPLPYQIDLRDQQIAEAQQEIKDMISNETISFIGGQDIHNILLQSKGFVYNGRLNTLT